MTMDISNHKDIELLVNTFYDEVKNDITIQHIFKEIIGDDWSHHLPIMYNFWGTVLLGEPGYSGNAVARHIDIDKRIPLKEEHFNAWIRLWKANIDKHFSGAKAEEAKKRGELMLQLIRFKVEQSHDKNFIR
jgi:hemoglobin